MSSTTRTAEVTGPIAGGRGVPFGSPSFDVAAHGCVMEELLLEGEAVSYRPVDGTGITLDGRWSTEEDARAPYRTRMYVVRPVDADRFNGVVLVNWQNVTIGWDLGAPSPADLDHGFAWVGVTAQRVAIEGQPAAGDALPATNGLPSVDPARYGTLAHPGDAFSYDLFAQAGRAVGHDRRRGGAIDPLGGLEPRMVLATGGSQSAMRLGSYLNMAHQRDRVFDGFLLHGHWGSCPYPPDQEMQVSRAALGNGLWGASSAIRDDGDVPVLVMSGETEAHHNFPVRQVDTPTFRWWELAGTAHGDPESHEEMERVFRRDGVLGARLAARHPSEVHWAYARNAAQQRLVEWVDDGTPPSSFPPIEIDAETGRIVRDELGNARGGVRLPDLVAPSAAHRGTNPEGPLQSLSGQSLPLEAAALVDRYGDADGYVTAWDAAVDGLVASGLVLPDGVEAVRTRGRRLAAARFPRG